MGGKGLSVIYRMLNDGFSKIAKARVAVTIRLHAPRGSPGEACRRANV